MTPDIERLLEDIKKARQQPGMNASWQDVLKRAHRAIGDLREMSAICESGCDRALSMLEVSTATCKALGSEVERLRAELQKIANPIGYFQEYAKREGRQIDGHMAVQISNDAGWLKSEAAKALSPAERVPGA